MEKASPSVLAIMTILQIALIILKILNIITISWLQVFTPIFAVLIVSALLFMLMGIWFFNLLVSVEIKTKEEIDKEK